MGTRSWVVVSWFNLSLAISTAGAAPADSESIAASKSQPRAVKPYSLEIVEADSNEAATVITVRFDRSLNWVNPPKLEEHGTFIQVTLPVAIAISSGQFYDGAGPYVSKVAAFQSTPDEGSLRLFLTKDASQVLKALSSEATDDVLKLTIDHKKLEGYGINAHVVVGEIPGTPALKDIVANTKVRGDISDPAAKLSQDIRVINRRDGPNLSDKMVVVAIFSGVMLVFLGLFHVLRSSFKKGRSGPAQESLQPLKLVANYTLAPKQRVALMEVAGEQILLGVSPDGISYLTTITRKPQPPPQRASVMPPFPVPGIDSPVRSRLPASAGANPENTPGKRAATQQGPVGAVNPPSKSPSPTKRVEVLAKTPKPESSRFSVMIDDDGIHESSPPAKAQGKHAIDDVTRLIRSKLKNLP